VKKRRYMTADVFTSRRFGGNPVAVVLDAEGLTASQMQAIALEFNYSETTFVLPPRNPANTAHVRIFTPRTEVPFAGHPNVGTAYVLATQRPALANGDERDLIFEEAAGLVPMRLLVEEGQIVGAEFRAPEALSRGSIFASDVTAACLSLSSEEIDICEHMPQIFSVGLPFVVVRLTSRESLSRAVPNISAYRSILPREGADAVFAYVLDSAPQVDGQARVLHARMFSPLDGIVEDPATGSAAAATIALLASKDQAGGGKMWRVHQGADMGRPSVLSGRTVNERDGGMSIYVGGRCVNVFEGHVMDEGSVS
jgi:trans-2,3-dihydro-3-hydroxyanthranilate isomerase